MQPNSFEGTVDEEFERVRLDVYLTEQIEDASRSFIKKLIKDKRVRVNGDVCTRPGRSMTAGDHVATEIPPAPAPDMTPESIPLDILYEDAELVVVNKPSGLVVHPAPGHYSGTLVNALLHHCPDMGQVGLDPERPGIVHRLDRDTSGVMVVAKSSRAFAHLAQQARDHAFDRRYLALVKGDFSENSGRIEAAVGRSTVDRKRMAVTGVHGRDAVTRFEVLERFGIASLISLQLETGRTHQIRVHMRFAGRPVLGDPVYGVDAFNSWEAPQAVRDALHRLEGQALHAERLGFVHPVSGDKLTFTAPPPDDFQAALDALRASIESA